MAKKARRVRKATTKSGQSGGTKAAKVRQTPEEMFRQEYAYVIKDLRRVFILAGIMFALLIGINILLQFL